MDSHDWFIDKLQTNNILYRIEETVKKNMYHRKWIEFKRPS